MQPLLTQHPRPHPLTPAPRTGKQAAEARIASALACPCVKDLREGPCGAAFEAAFRCYHRSREVPQGAECGAANLAMAACLQSTPGALDAFRHAQESSFGEEDSQSQRAGGKGGAGSGGRGGS